MNIIVGKDNADQIKERYLVLSLGIAEGHTENAYCVIDRDCLNMNELATLSNMVELHENLVKEFEKKNFNYCKNAIEHLRGKFGGQVDSFYDYIEQLVQ